MDCWGGGGGWSGGWVDVGRLGMVAVGGSVGWVGSWWVGGKWVSGWVGW